MGHLAAWQRCQNPISWPRALGTEPSFLPAPPPGGAQLCVRLQEPRCCHGDPGTVQTHPAILLTGILGRRWNQLGHVSQGSTPGEPPAERVESSHLWGGLSFLEGQGKDLGHGVTAVYCQVCVTSLFFSLQLCDYSVYRMQKLRHRKVQLLVQGTQLSVSGRI